MPRKKQPKFRTFQRPKPVLGWEDRDGLATYQGKLLRYSIHHYFGCGDTLFLSCYDLRIEQYQLKSTTIPEAKVEAKAILLNRATYALKDIQES